MRVSASFLFLLSLILVPANARADSMDHFSVVSAGVDIEFNLPASVTGPDGIAGQYLAPSVPGSLNGVSSTVFAHFIFPGSCSVCDTLFLSVAPDGSTSGTTYEFGLPSLYQFTYPTQDSVTLTYIPGTYASPYIITPLTNTQPGTITVTAQSTATTPEPPSLLLLATALFASPLLLRRLRPQQAAQSHR